MKKYVLKGQEFLEEKKNCCTSQDGGKMQNQKQTWRNRWQSFLKDIFLPRPTGLRPQTDHLGSSGGAWFPALSRSPGPVPPSPSRLPRTWSARRAAPVPETVFGQDWLVVQQFSHQATSEGDGGPLQRRDKGGGRGGCDRLLGDLKMGGGSREVGCSAERAEEGAVPGGGGRPRRGGRGLAGGPRTSEALLCVRFWAKMRPQTRDGDPGTSNGPAAGQLVKK